MHVNRLFIIVSAVILHAGMANAQEIYRKSYPEPKLTQEVLEIRAGRVPFVPLTEGVDLPASVDNSKQKFFPPIIDQQGGSCAQAAGIGYMFTYEVNRLLNRDATASKENRFSYQFSWNLLNDGEDQGGFVENGLFLAKQYGMMTEQDYGISSTYQFKWASGYEKYLNAMRYRTKEILTFDDSIPLMKRYLYDAGDGSAVGGVLTFSGQSTGWQIDNNYSGPSETGYHSLLYSLATSGAHAMTIAGYDDTVTYTDTDGVQHFGAFIVVNSWGTYMHDEGHFYLPYDFFRDPTVNNLVLSNSVNAVRVETYNPQVVARVTVDFTSRDDLAFGVGASDNAAGASRYYYGTAFNHQGGDFPMQGQYLSSEIELAFDITSVMEDKEHNYSHYFLNVIKGYKGKKKGEGKLVKFSVIDYRGTTPVEYAYTGQLPKDLVDGDNKFALSAIPQVPVSASPYKYQDANGNVSSSTYLVKTANGKLSKVSFSLSGTGTVSLRYQVSKK